MRNSILEIFHEAVSRFGDRTALRLKDREISFTGLRNMAAAIAGILCRHGLGDRDRIAILSENRPEWAAAFFGIVSMSGIVVPIDSRLSWPEIIFILNDSKCRCIFVSAPFLGISNHRQALPLLEQVICLDRTDENLIQIADFQSSSSEDGCAPHADPDATALIVYTSGTMGVAKGVELTYGNLLFETRALNSVLEISPDDHFISILPLNHMFELVAGLIGPLYGGAGITYCESLSAPSITALLNQQQATMIVCVPLILKMIHNGILRQIREMPDPVRKAFDLMLKFSLCLNRLGINPGRFLFRTIHRKFGGRLRCFYCGGAPLDISLESDLRAMGFNVFQGYGLTETSPVVSVNTFRDNRLGSVGKPLPGVEVKIERSNASDPRTGELLVRGPNLMSGYSGKPDLTSSVIRDGWFHTGDLGYLDHGYLFLSGRKKNLIVLGAGKKVYPEEVEEVIGRSEFIREICVLGKAAEGSRKGSEKVHAVIFPDLDRFEPADRSKNLVRKTIAAEINRLSRNLADYKRISSFEIWDQELPKTASRKIKRALVNDLVKNAKTEIPSQENGKNIPTGNEFTDDLREIVARISGSGIEISMQSNLYADLGIDSLMKIEVFSALQREKGISIPESSAFEINTMEELCRFAISGPLERENDDDFRDEARKIMETNAKFSVFHQMSYLLFRSIFKTFLDCRVEGLENIPEKGSFIVAANHASLLDFPLILTALPFNRVRDILAPAARDYFFSKKIKGSAVRFFFNTFPFDRLGDFVRGLRICEELILLGKSVILFPEGTRTRDGSLTEFKPGIGALALRLKIPVVPVYIYGADKSLPKGAMIPKPAKVGILIGPQIQAGRMDMSGCGTDYEKYRLISRQIRDAVVSLVDKHEN
ncbi:MAG: AMP-binding protein [Candidatus Wallbacteria bacterium]|nr:AMP-binding protein [Candidatus Wallbacteria bacterium]